MYNVLITYVFFFRKIVALLLYIDSGKIIAFTLNEHHPVYTCILRERQTLFGHAIHFFRATVFTTAHSVLHTHTHTYILQAGGGLWD